MQQNHSFIFSQQKKIRVIQPQKQQITQQTHTTHISLERLNSALADVLQHQVSDHVHENSVHEKHLGKRGEGDV